MFWTSSSFGELSADAVDKHAKNNAAAKHPIKPRLFTLSLHGLSDEIF
jgi:hypothetical protein